MKMIRLKMRILQKWNALKENNKGIGTVEIILILVVLIGLVIIFKNQLTTLVNNIFGEITRKSRSIY